jgi:predicted HAD superfamily phosphohydrolase
MFAVLTLAAPAASPETGLVVAGTIALAVTVLAAIAMVVVSLRRSSRLTLVTGAAAAVSAVAVLAGAFFVGGSLTQSPATNATVLGTRQAAVAPTDTKLDGLQLPTLALDD